jgi:hypothetical protein
MFLITLLTYAAVSYNDFQNLKTNSWVSLEDKKLCYMGAVPSEQIPPFNPGLGEWLLWNPKLENLQPNSSYECVKVESPNIAYYMNMGVHSRTNASTWDGIHVFRFEGDIVSTQTTPETKYILDTILKKNESLLNKLKEEREEDKVYNIHKAFSEIFNEEKKYEDIPVGIPYLDIVLEVLDNKDYKIGYYREDERLSDISGVISEDLSDKEATFFEASEKLDPQKKSNGFFESKYEWIKKNDLSDNELPVSDVAENHKKESYNFFEYKNEWIKKADLAYKKVFKKDKIKDKKVNQYFIKHQPPLYVKKTDLNQVKKNKKKRSKKHSSVPQE